MAGAEFSRAGAECVLTAANAASSSAVSSVPRGLRAATPTLVAVLRLAMDAGEGAVRDRALDEKPNSAAKLVTVDFQSSSKVIVWTF